MQMEGVHKANWTDNIMTSVELLASRTWFLSLYEYVIYAWASEFR